MLKRKNRVGRVKVPDFKTHYYQKKKRKERVTKLAWRWLKDRHVDQRRRTEK